jgi:thioredoxin 1
MVEINNNNFKSEVLENELVLVDFNADWCGPCQMLKPVLEEIASERSTKIVSVNVDDNMELAREYGIMTIPCLILFKDGKEIKRSVGLKSKDDIISMMEE